jgi:hypothetical protein
MVHFILDLIQEYIFIFGRQKRRQQKAYKSLFDPLSPTHWTLLKMTHMTSLISNGPE